MSKVDLGSGLGIDNFAMPINEATAMNIASTDSIAIADADQIVIIQQVDEDRGGGVMDHKPELTHDEMEAETVAALPNREAMSLLDLNADLDLALDLAAPVDAALAVNANVAAPIDAAVAANVLSFDSEAAALADQDSVIVQDLDGTAEANAIQDATVDQSGGGAVTG